MTRYKIAGTNDEPIKRYEISRKTRCVFTSMTTTTRDFGMQRDCLFHAEQLFNEARERQEIVPVIED